MGWAVSGWMDEWIGVGKWMDEWVVGVRWEVRVVEGKGHG